MIDAQDTITTPQIVLPQVAIYSVFIAAMVWLYRGKNIRRWWRRRKLNTPNEETNVKTISGPTWVVVWVKVSEAPEKRPDEQRSTVLGNTLPEVIAVLKAKFGDEFDERNVRSADKRDYIEVIVGIPEKVSSAGGKQ